MTDEPLKGRAKAKADTRAKVLEAARICFHSMGYEAATVRAVSKMAGVSTGAVFSNFTSKDAMYVEIYGHPPINAEKARRLLEAASNIIPEGDGTGADAAELRDAIATCRS